jgi:two-component system NtrC family sensor kinase
MGFNGLLAISVLQGAASLLLFLLYLLLYPSCSERFSRYWLAGWALNTLVPICTLMPRPWGGESLESVGVELSFGASLFFLATIFQYIGREQPLRYLWPAGALAVALLSIGLTGAAALAAVRWWSRPIEAGLYLAAGWLLWRAAGRAKGYGATLLAAPLLLRGLHTLDRGSWAALPEMQLRMAFDAVLSVAAGVGMAVLLLEAARARTEDLNAKLSRLTLITTAATELLCVDDVLNKVLAHLLESLKTSHGFISLMEGQGEGAQLVLRAAAGFREDLHREHSRLPASEPWVRLMFSEESNFYSLGGTTDPELRQWMKLEGLAALEVVRIPGKEGPLGLLGVASAHPRLFHQDEVNFLINVGNLLGLTIQNILHFEKAATAERQWEATFDHITDPILVHDAQYRLIRANRVVLQRLGEKAATCIGQPLRDLLRRGEARWNHCPYCEGVAGHAEGPDPTFFGYLLATSSPYEDPVDGRKGTIHALRDITERKRAEEKYRNLFENVQEGVFISTPDGRFIEINDAFCQMLGYSSRDELLQVDISSTLFVNPADRERLKKLLREHGSVTAFEFQMRRRDGEVITVLESSVAHRNSTGEVVAYEGFVLDITERRQADIELRRRNRELLLLNAIGTTLSQPLALGDLLSRTLRQVAELFALDLGVIYLLEESSGMMVRRAALGFRAEGPAQFPAHLISGEVLQQLRHTRTTVLAPQALSAIPYLRTLDETEALEVSRLVILWSKEHLLGGVIVGSRSRREFSTAEVNLLAAIGNQMAATLEKAALYEETRRAFDDLRRTQEHLVQSEKMVALGQLISGVAHELNNPLTAILGYSQLLSATQEVLPQVADYSAKITKQAHRTQRIVQNLLSFARQHKPERRPIQLNDVLEDTLQLREYDWKRNNIVIQREFDSRLPLTTGDSHQLQQVFLNILNNAFDAVKEQPGAREICIRTRVRDLHLVVEIEDTGPGVQEPRRVFDPFYTTKPIGEGTGLGLSICYGIVKEHGGEISADNRLPSGACFTVVLPISTSVDSREPATAGRDLAALSAGSVLLVDDEEAVIEVEREILRERGHVVHTATSGAQAVEILGRSAVDAVVASFKLPGEFGGEALYRWIERNCPSLAPRLVFTLSDGQVEAARKLTAHSGGSALQKPFRAEEFLQVVEQAIGEKSAITAKDLEILKS